MPRTSLVLLAALLLPAATAGQVPAPDPLAPPGGAPPDAPSPGPTEGIPPGETQRHGGTTSPKEKKEAQKPLPRGSVLEEISGVLRDVDRRGHRVTIEGQNGPVTLTMDRNTLVYGPSGLVTVDHLVPGAPVRAGRNADHLAYWVQIRGAGRLVPAGKPAPASTPGQGTGPAGGSGAPAGETGGGTGATETAPPSPEPGSATPGPATPPTGGP